MEILETKPHSIEDKPRNIEDVSWPKLMMTFVLLYSAALLAHHNIYIQLWIFSNATTDTTKEKNNILGFF